MDVTPALLAREKCLQDGQLVRFFGRVAQADSDEIEDDSLKIADLLHQSTLCGVRLAPGCALPEPAAIIRVTGPWHKDGIVEAYEIVTVEDGETLRSLQNRERLRLLSFQASSAYKIARTRLRQAK